MHKRDDPLITRVQPLRPRGLKVLIHLDIGDPFEVMLEALERNRLGVGDPLPASQRQHLLDKDADIRVRDASLNLLSYRARTRTELARRLKQKGFATERIEPCLDRLTERGFLDDSAVAEAFVRDRLRHRPRGRARLTSELRTKGIDSTLAERAISRVFEAEEVDDAHVAEGCATAWVARQAPGTLAGLTSEDRTQRDKARRRLLAYMARRGFRGEALGRAMERAVNLARSS